MTFRIRTPYNLLCMSIPKLQRNMYLHLQCGTELRWASGWIYRSQRNNLNTEDRNGQWEEATWSLMEQRLMVGLVPGYEEETLAVSFQGYWIPCRVIEPRVTKVPLQNYRRRVTKIPSQSYRSRVTKVLSQSYRSRVTKFPSQSFRSQSVRFLLRATELNVKGILSQGYRWRIQMNPVQCR